MQTDMEIIQLCLKGDQEALAELVNRYKKLVFSVVYRMIHDPEEAKDMAQEAFIRIYRSLDKYKSDYKFSTWSVKITTNLCLDFLRKKKLDTVSVEDLLVQPEGGLNPEATYLKSERKLTLDSAVRSLPEKYRLPIILFHQNGLSYDEICKILNQPLSIVKNRLHRARLMLRQKLQQEIREEAL